MTPRQALTDGQWNRIQGCCPARSETPGDRRRTTVCLSMQGFHREDRRALAGLAETFWEPELDLASV
jgi:hypothetical protein